MLHSAIHPSAICNLTIKAKINLHKELNKLPLRVYSVLKQIIYSMNALGEITGKILHSWRTSIGLKKMQLAVLMGGGCRYKYQ